MALVGDAARVHRGRDNELPVHDLSANRRGAPGAICPLSFCAGGLRGAERQHRDEREDKPRADAEARAAKPHRARMARGQSRRIGRSAHFQLGQVLSSGRRGDGFLQGGTHLTKPLPATSPDQSPTPLQHLERRRLWLRRMVAGVRCPLGEGGSLPSPNRVSAASSLLPFEAGQSVNDWNASCELSCSFVRSWSYDWNCSGYEPDFRSWWLASAMSDERC